MTGSLFIEIECIEAYLLLNNNVAFLPYGAAVVIMCFSLSQTDGRRCHKPLARPKTSSWMENCTKFGQLIISKIIKIVGNGCQILSLKCTKFDFGWGSAPDPAGGAHSAPPDPLAAFRGPTSKGGEGEGGEEPGKGKRNVPANINVRLHPWPTAAKRMKIDPHCQDGIVAH